jgi:hypothetical protein
MIGVTVRRERRWTSLGASPATASLRPIPARRDSDEVLTICDS